MAKLVVLLHGQKLSELNLQTGREYFAGRSTQSEIILANERGISRQHLKIHQVDGIWTATLVAKYGGMIFSGQAVQSIQLNADLSFTIPPYEIHYLAEAHAATPEKPASTQSAIVPAETKTEQLSQSQPSVPAAENTGSLNLALDDTGSMSDKTSVGQFKLVAFLRVANNQSNTEEIFKLEGDSWSAGRLPACEVVIPDAAMSRKHFDIKKNQDGYYITDHGSSNGTLLNGEKLVPNKPHKIVSGDIIVIRHLSITFEIRDLSFENKLMRLPVSASDRTIENENSNHAAVLRIPSSDNISSQIRNFKPNKVHIAIMGLSLVLIVGLFSGGNDKSKNLSSQSSSNEPNDGQTPNLPLNGDKLKEVNDTFYLAKNYYLQRKYSLCISQLEKLHALVPFHENSKEIDSLCHQALDLEKIEADRRRREEARIEVENKIQSVVQSCRAKITDQTTLDELNICLQPAIELAPEHIQIAEMQTEIKIRDEQKLTQASEKASLLRRKAAGQQAYQQAMKLLRSGQLKAALNQFQKFIQSQYPQMQNETAAARREVASIQQKLNQDLKEQVSICKSALDKRALKAAILACDKVLKENPGHPEAKSIRNKALSELQREMKALYEDSVLEESIGNIESAKEKWSKIIELSIPQDSYYQKAQQKLKRYGIGM